MIDAGIHKYRENTAKSTVYVHRRRQCACGKSVTAKQLTQYGKCSSCIKSK